MYTEKDYELARDIAREQYTDDPDDPYWWDDEDEDEDDEDEDEDDEPRNSYERYPGVVTYPNC